MKNPHNILGVPADASHQEVKRAYRAQVQQCHPDHNKSKAASKQFLLLTAAYEQLCNEQQQPAQQQQQAVKTKQRPVKAPPQGRRVVVTTELSGAANWCDHMHRQLLIQAEQRRLVMEAKMLPQGYNKKMEFTLTGGEVLVDEVLDWLRMQVGLHNQHGLTRAKH